jgi:uncharacterized membrane protein
LRLNKWHALILVITLICTGISIYIPLDNYELLPEKYPTHFNLSGEPDSWSPKSVLTVLAGPLVMAASILLLLLPLTVYAARVKDPRKIINGPKKKVEHMSLERAEKIRSITVFHLLLITLLMALLVMALSIDSVKVALEIRTKLSPLGLVVTALLLLDSLYLTWKLIRLVYK